MSELKPGDKFVAIVHGTVLDGGNGRISLFIESGTEDSWPSVMFPSDFDAVLPADSVRTEYAVAHGLSEDEGAGPGDAAGHEVFDDEAAAFEDAQWRVKSGVFVRDVVAGPWKRVWS